MAAGDHSLQIVLTAKDATGPAFAGAVRNVRQMEGALAGLDKAAVGFQSFVGKLQAGAAAFGFSLGIAQAISFTKSVMGAVGGLGELAEQLGINTQALQAWQAAALQSGVSEQQLEAGVMKLQRRIGEAAAGNKEAVESFQQLGVKILDVSGKVRPLEDTLPEIAGKIMSLGSESEKSAKSQEFLGRSGARWLTMLGEMAGGTDALNERLRAQGLILKDGVITQLDAWDDKMKVVERQLRNLWAEFLVTEVPPALEKMKEFWEATSREIQFVVDLYRMLGGKMLLPQTEVDEIRKKEQLAKLEEEAAFYRNLNTTNITDQQRINNAEKIRDIELQIAGIKGTSVLPPVVVTAEKGDFPKSPNKPGALHPRITGGAGGESMDKQIDKLRLQAEDYAQALQRISSSTRTPWPEWEKQIDSLLQVDKQVTDFRASNKLDENDPMAVRFRAQATATEEARQALERYKTASSDADKFERQFGDGKLALAETMTHLDRALATGRLSWDAYTIAVKNAKDAQAAQALEMRGQADGWDAFVAGMQKAQTEWDRANNAFAQGQQFFENSMRHMEDALLAFVQTGKLSFRSLINSMIADLIRMQVRAASTGLFSALGNLLGPLFSSTPGGLDPFGNPISARAAGGPVEAGRMYMVGEDGPEPFIPGRSGTILPNEALGGMGGGVTIHQSYVINGGDEAAVDRAMIRWMPVMRRQALDAVMDARSRGGRFGQTFRQ